MEALEAWLQHHVSLYIGLIAACLLVLFLLNVIVFVKLTGLKKRIVAVLGGDQTDNLEDALLSLHAQTEEMKMTMQVHMKALTDIQHVMRRMKGKVGLYRYNAFMNDDGGDLSFSVAIMDEDQNGIVVSSIHHRDVCYMYAKPLQEGKSSYALTPEERKAIELAEHR